MAAITPTAYTVDPDDTAGDEYELIALATARATAAKALESMYDILRRFPLNLLQAHWRLWPETLDVIRKHHNPAVVQLVTDEEGRTIVWGVAVVEDEQYAMAAPATLVVTGRR